MKVEVKHPNSAGFKKKLRKDAHKHILETLLGDWTLEEVLIQLLAKDWRPGQYRLGVGIPEEHILAAQEALRCTRTAVTLGKKPSDVLSLTVEFEKKKEEIIKTAKEKEDKEFEEPGDPDEGKDK